MKTTITTLSLAALTACGGGGGSGDGASATSSDYATEQAVLQPVSTTTVAKPASRQEAARFLTQATFGPTPAAIDHLMAVGYSAWLQEQFAAPQSNSYKGYWEYRTGVLQQARATARAGGTEINHLFWRNAVTGNDQLRQRVALALSEIFVVSLHEQCVIDNSRGAASYLDMLHQRAFGSYREVLESVSLHPIMGCYLSHLRNQKEDAVTGRVPDENFAREIMQLFSIGAVQLNMNGTPKLGGNGAPLETYSAADVSGLARVFTGWSFACPDYPSDNCFRAGTRDGYPNYNPDRWVLAMRPYPKFHQSETTKSFLGVTIPVGTGPEASLKIALDTLDQHANVAPFIAKQMIQRFVTSNPSPEYVARVANTFQSSGRSLKALMVAILMDPEARNMSAAQTSTTFGKVREPILRLSALLRAYGAQSASGNFLLFTTGSASNGLNQNVLQSPSVFNFFRPGYVPPGSATARANLKSPEMQIVHETSAASYVNYMRDVIWAGVGMKGYDNLGTGPDVSLEYQRTLGSSPTLALAMNPSALVEDVNQRLMYGSMPQALKDEIINTVNIVWMGSKTNQTAADALETKKRRVWVALLLTVASPEFQIQK